MRLECKRDRKLAVPGFSRSTVHSGCATIVYTVPVVMAGLAQDDLPGRRPSGLMSYVISLSSRPVYQVMESACDDILVIYSGYRAKRDILVHPGLHQPGVYAYNTYVT